MLCNISTGLVKCSRVRETPRKAKGEVLDSEYYRKQWNTALLPLANNMITSLGRHSSQIEQRIDPFFDHVTKFAFSRTTQQGNVVGSTICPNKRFSNLIILTSGGSNSIAFANESHDDKRDWFDNSSLVDGFEAFRLKLLGDIASLKGNAKQTGASQLPLLLKMINHLDLLKSLSPNESYNKATVCGYKFLGSWSGKDDCTSVLYSFFLHTALGIAVMIESDIYHWFRDG